MSLATIIVLLVTIPVVAVIAAVPAMRAGFLGALRQRSFVGAAALLALAAVGLNAATQAMQLRFRKEAVPLAVPSLDDGKLGIPSKVGRWVQVSVDEPLDHGMQEVLGTNQFVFREYLDSRLVDAATVEWFKDKSSVERARKLLEIQAKNPEAVVRFALTYYTGLVDTVPHVPEKCYVADGFDIATPPETRHEVLGTTAGGEPRPIAYRYLNFQDTTGNGRVDRHVAYVFHVNGHYEASNVGVRTELANLFQRYGYFAKIELMTTSLKASNGPAELEAARAKSLGAFNDLLTAVLPDVERCLPDWKAVTAKK